MTFFFCFNERLWTFGEGVGGAVGFAVDVRYAPPGGLLEELADGEQVGAQKRVVGGVAANDAVDHELGLDAALRPPLPVARDQLRVRAGARII